MAAGLCSTGSADVVRVSASASFAGEVSNPPSMSADGRYVAFESPSPNLVPGDGNGFSDIFVRDTASQTLTRVSVASTGEEANGWSRRPCLSADGRYAVFESAADNLVPGDTNGCVDVFLKDLGTGEVRRVSVSSLGEEADGASHGAQISADGSAVAFESLATNLVPGDTNETWDVFVKYLGTGEVRRASVTPAGQEANGPSGAASISADGFAVAFESQASNLVAGDANGVSDVFVRDFATDRLLCASAAANGQPASGESRFPSLSADGRRVAFQSAASTLAPEDTNGAWDIFVRDLPTGTLRRVSVCAFGQEGDFGSWSPRLSADGRLVAFWSDARNLVADDLSGYADVFVKDLTSGIVLRASVAPGGQEAAGESRYPCLSPDGRLVAFWSDAPNLQPGGGDMTGDVFLADTGFEAPAAAASAVASTLVVDPPTGVPPDGVSSAQAIATLRDDSGRPLPGRLVTFAVDGGAVVDAWAVTDAQGRAVAQVRSSSAGAKTVAAAADPGGSPVELAAWAVVVFNTRPVALPGTAEAMEGAGTPITLVGQDADGDPLEFVVVQPPAHGTLTGSAPTLTYTPEPAYEGPDSFWFVARDATDESEPAQVVLNVRMANLPPVASDLKVTLVAGTRAEVLLSALDREGAPLVYTIVSGPSHGTLTEPVGNRVVYTPEPGYTGSDTFVFRASDGVQDSNPAAVSLTITEAPALVAIGRVEAAPGQTAVIPVTVTETTPSVTGLDLTLRVVVPAGAPELPAPTFALGSDAVGWALQTDPENPWRCTVADATGRTTPAELLRITVTIPAEAPPGAVYGLEALTATVTDREARETTSPAIVTPGAAAVALRLKGDVNGDGYVSLADVIWVLKLFVNGDEPPNPEAPAVADVNHDGVLSLGDVILILRHYVLGVPLPD